MIDLADLGIDVEHDHTPPAPKAAPTTTEASAYSSALQPGSVGAQALWHVWRGDPLVAVDSPPGGGKSTTVAQIVARLVKDSDLQVVVASPTVRSAEMLAEKLATLLDPGQVVLSGGSFVRDVPGVVRGSAGTKRSVAVRTVKSCQMRPPQLDVLIVDEAYQVTFSDLVGAAAQADQILMVGDPGQIGPVNTVNTAPWGRMRTSPADRAPEGFLQREDAVHLHLDRSFRLGQDTVEAIAPLYDFSFTSARPDAFIDGLEELEGLELPVTSEPADPEAMRLIAEAAVDLVGRDAVVNGEETTVTASDVAVVAARNEQVSMLSAILRAMGAGRITVGTADSLQGGEWLAVVAVDPLMGAQSASTHALSLGRLCVMASRHVAHLTWAASPDYRDVLSAAVPDPEVSRIHRKVRTSLLGF